MVILHKRYIDFIVGIFVLVAVAAFVLLAFRVSGLVHVGNTDTYKISADFDNIGGLQARAAVRVAGVTIGTVQAIDLDPKTFRANVIMQIDDKYNDIPIDSSAGIYTQGILGANYVNIVPGFDNSMLKNGSVINTTQSAMILENLIGQLLYSMKGGDDKKSSDSNSTETTTAAPTPAANTTAPATKAQQSAGAITLE